MLPISSVIILYIYAFTVVSPAITCDTPYQCVDQTLSDNQITINSYRGANGPSTSFTSKSSNAAGEMKCGGAFSCQSMQFVHSAASDLFCYGTHSCSNTTIVSTTGATRCTGVNSCTFSYINSSDISLLTCLAYGACAETHIHSIETIYVRGTYSLYKAIIDTKNSSGELTITLSGDYAGYYATIICRKEYQCNIYCDGYNSCYMLFVDCIGVCNIYNQTQDTILPITNITEFQMLLNHTGFAFRTTPLSNDEECNAATDNVFDSDHERYDGEDIIISDDNEGPICCRASASCKMINRIGYEPTAKGNIICSGVISCSYSKLTSNKGIVFCEAHRSCYYSQIDNAAFIYCMASDSCYDSIITGSRSILCDAKKACYNATIMSDGDDLNVYFGGYDSGRYASIYCNVTDVCDIVCAGYSSCIDTTLICNGICTVQCNTESYCPLGWNTTVQTMSFTSNPTQYLSQSPSEYTSNPTNYPTQYPSEPQYTYNPTQYPSDISVVTEYTSNPSSGGSQDPTLFTPYTTYNPSDTNTTPIMFTSNPDPLKSTIKETKSNSISANDSSVVILYIAGIIASFCVFCCCILLIWKTVTQKRWDPEPHKIPRDRPQVAQPVDAPYLDEIDDESAHNEDGLQVFERKKENRMSIGNIMTSEGEENANFDEGNENGNAEGPMTQTNSIETSVIIK